MLADAYHLWSTYSWGGPLCWFDYRDKGNDTSTQKDFFGLYSTNGTPKPAVAQYTAVVHSVR
jgi:hypothetical protein